MDFLTATVISGIAWDGIKAMGNITGAYIKSKLQGWIIDDNIAGEIAQSINQMPQPFKENAKYIEAYINENNQLMETIKNIKKDIDIQTVYKQDNSNSEIKESTIINGNNNPITNNYYYGDSKTSKENSEYKPEFNRRELKGEIGKILAENRVIYKMYGPTDANKVDLFSKKPCIWKEKALNNIVPNNRRIVQLLESNSSLLTGEEFEVFIAFKLHADGFESNQKKKEKISEYPMFPEEIHSILN